MIEIFSSLKIQNQKQDLGLFKTVRTLQIICVDQL